MITGLHHIAVAVGDFEAASAQYERLFGIAPQREDDDGAQRAWFWLDNVGLEVIAPDGDGASGDRVRRRLEAAGGGQWLLALTSDDFEVDARLCERRGLAIAERTPRAVLFEPTATGGVQIALMSFPPLASQATGAIFALDHVVIQTRNIDRAVANFGGRLGMDLRLDRADPDLGARQLFFRCGSGVVEFGSSLKGGTSDALDTFGGLAWRVRDPHAARDRMAASGFDVSDVRVGRKPGTHVFTVRDAPGAVPTLMISQSTNTETL